MNTPIVLIQARMGSTRFPGKVLKPLLGRPMLGHLVERVRYARGLHDVVVATSDRSEDGVIRRFCHNEGIHVFAGSEPDVLDRFYQAAVAFGADPVLRVTGDCPLIDPELIERLLELYAGGAYDHVSVATGAGALFLDGGRYPNGLDAECFSFAALQQAWSQATENSDREHVTPYIWRVPDRFRCHMIRSPIDYSHLRWTVDYEDDYLMVKRIYEALYRPERPFLYREIVEHLNRNPELSAANQAHIGQEGYARVWHPETSERNGQ
jgi:spore coat polysaccharide biosynthesis protein SpsF